MINLYSSRVHPRRVSPSNNWIEGLSDFNKIGGSYLWARGVDYRTEPSQLSLLPAPLAEGTQAVMMDLIKWSEQVVGRTVILGTNTNLITNGSFETNTTGWTLGADFTRASDDSYSGAFSIKQVSTSGTAALTTASGSGLTVTSYADYQLTFYIKVALTSGQAPQLQVLGGSLSGPNLLSTPYVLADTAGVWQAVTVSFNAGQYTSVFIKIANASGNVTAHYDVFSLNQINSLASFALGNAGNIYKRYANAAWVGLGSIPNSHGNGMAYYGEDDYLYLMGDKTVGRYGPISSGTPTLVTDYLTAAGGVPTNTNSISLLAANSDYAAKATPAAALKITGDIALEAFIKPSSLPAVGSSMTIMGIWNETGNQRAYKLDLFGISSFFGDGSASSLTISVNTTEAPTDASASGTSGTTTLNANNAGFAAGQIILIIQMTGTGAGTYQKTKIQSYDGTNHIITTTDALNFSYNSSGTNKAQVRVLPQYTNVTINNGVTYKPKAWDSSTGLGGVLAFICNGTLTINGTLSLAGIAAAAQNGGVGLGFRGASTAGSSPGDNGDGTGGVGIPQTANAGNGGGGGAGQSGAAGGGNGGVGTNGTQVGSDTPGSAGTISSSSDLTTMTMGGGGGSSWTTNGGAGGGGGAIGYINAPTITGTGTINANGGNGSNATQEGGGGGGAGGSLLINTQNATLTGMTITLTGGTGGTAISGGTGGSGGAGAMHINYLTSVTGTSSPAFTSTQSPSLVTTAQTQIRLGISNDGTAFEYLSQVLSSIQLAQWDRLQVSWDSVNSKASFYENATLIGTAVGTKTSIFATPTADFAIGGNGVSGYANFFDGLVNDARVWNAQRTQAQFASYNTVNLQGIATGLVGSWFLSNSANDQTSNGDNLTLNGTPTPLYSIDVPYPGATTRGDIDQTGGGTTNTYTLPVSLTEAQSKSFVPAHDPQKSLQVNINARGTGNWTLVVHDGLNQQVATVTVANANLPASGQYEFVYPLVFSPVVGATYHFHLYSTVNDGTIKTTSAADMTTAQFTTYFQFLLNDSDYHPAMQMGNNLAIGNGRYLAVLSASGGDSVGIYNGQGFNERRLRFPAGWRVRSLARWRGFYAIGCWKGSSIKDFDQGIVFLWDGYSITYNDFFEVPEGAVNAMHGENGTLYIVAGYKGDLLEYTGGDRAVKVKRIPKVGNANYIEVSPGAMTYYGALLRIGVSYNSDSTTLERGVYTWGTLNDKYPKSLSYDYPVSTGSRGSTVKIGALMPVGGSLLIYYQDNTAYGVNNVSPSNAPQATGTIEELISDYGLVWKEKEMLVIRADHLPLPTGGNIDLKYKLNYETNWHNLGTTNQKLGDQVTRFPIKLPNNPRYHVLQIAADLTATTLSPTLVEHSQLSDLMISQTDEHAGYG